MPSSAFGFFAGYILLAGIILILVGGLGIAFNFRKSRESDKGNTKTWIVWSIILIFGIFIFLFPFYWKEPLKEIPLDHPLADRSYLTRHPCEYPCWYGIKLGESSTDEVLEILQSLDFVDKDSIRDVGDDLITYNCVYSKERCGAILYHQKLVTEIHHTVAYPLTLGDVIEIEGIPEYLYVEQYGPPGYKYILYLAWPQKKLQVSYFMNNEQHEEMLQEYRLDPTIQLTEISYKIESKFTSCSYSEVECFDWTGFRE